MPAAGEREFYTGLIEGLQSALIEQKKKCEVAQAARDIAIDEVAHLQVANENLQSRICYLESLLKLNENYKAMNGG